jgi:DNA-directed RNA polymerase specialized sigma54-like protein
MAISQRLHTKLVQKLILTPSLQQAIKLLPMSTLELSELLNQEMVENPMLEESPTENLEQQEAAPEKPEEKPATQEKGDTWDDQDYEYFFGDYLDDGYRPRTPTEVKELPPIENTLSTAASLSDHLLWQLSMQTNEPALPHHRGSDHRQPRRRRLPGRDRGRALVHGARGPRTTSRRRSSWSRAWTRSAWPRADLQESLLLQLRHLKVTGSPEERIVVPERIVTEYMRLLRTTRFRSSPRSSASRSTS